VAQIFHPLTNALARATIFGAVFGVFAVIAVLYAVGTSDYATQTRVVRAQPVDFSHQHHVAGLGIDCRFCHSSAETSPFAGLPATEVCMNCHSEIWSDSPKLAPVRESYRTGAPLAWVRVTDLPDFVHFDHGVHVQKGIACVECHGRIDRMPLTWREYPMQMRWCLDCHRHPVPHVRQRDDVFTMTGTRLANEQAAQLAADYQVRRVTDCSACHY
jgi:hypothetical protein